MSDAPSKTLPLRKPGMVALVDATDHARLSRYCWLLDRHYVYRNRTASEDGQKQGLAHAVLDLPRLSRVEFVNGNTLDCRRANLRPVLGFVYVNRRSRRCPFRVQFSIDAHQFDCGGYARRAQAEEMRTALASLVAALRGRRLTRREIQRQLDQAAGRIVRRYASEQATAKLLRDVAALVPAGLPADLREEVTQAIIVDLLAGAITRQELNSRAVRRYVRAAYGLRDVFRFRSLDAPLAEAGGRTLADMLVA